MKLFGTIFLASAIALLAACGNASTNDKKSESKEAVKASNELPDKEYVEKIVLDASKGDLSNYTKDFKKITEQRTELPRIWWDMQFGSFYYPYNGGDIDCGELTNVSVTDIAEDPDSERIIALASYTLQFEYGDKEEKESAVIMRFENGKWRIDDFAFPNEYDTQSNNEPYYIKDSFNKMIREVNNDITERYDEILSNFRSEYAYDPSGYKEMESKLNDYIEKYNVNVKKH